MEAATADEVIQVASHLMEENDWKLWRCSPDQPTSRRDGVPPGGHRGRAGTAVGWHSDAREHYSKPSSTRLEATQERCLAARTREDQFDTSDLTRTEEAQ